MGLRVLHVINALNRGGIEVWLLSVLRQIDRSECQMDFYCKGATAGALAGVAEQLDAVVLHRPMGVNPFGLARTLKQTLASDRYDVVHSHVDVYGSSVLWAARQQGVPVIASFHNTSFPPQTRLTSLPLLRQLRSVYGRVNIRQALRQADLVTGCSQGVLASLDPTGREIGERGRVLYYGVPLPPPATPADRAALRRSFGWPAETPLVLHVGRLIEQKNHLGMLSIFEQVLKRVPTAKLLLVGEGELRPAIEQAVAERGLMESVRLLGARDDVPALMTASDVFLFPSLHEGFGLVALEANAAGLPVVGTRIPGLCEAVVDGETALLHEASNQKGMAASVIALLTHRGYAERLGQAGRARVAERFSTAASANYLLELYHSLIRQPYGQTAVRELKPA